MLRAGQPGRGWALLLILDILIGALLITAMAEFRGPIAGLLFATTSLVTQGACT